MQQRLDRLLDSKLARNPGTARTPEFLTQDIVLDQLLEETFERDLAQSREYTLEEFRNRPVWERVTEWLTIPFRSQL